MTRPTTGTIHALDDVLINLHGWFSRALPARLTIDSGDTVVYRTSDADLPGRLTSGRADARHG